MKMIVIGAGSAGLATAALLQKDGADVEVLEAGSAPGASWSSRYDSLRLNTVRQLSGLPGRAIPRAYGRWVGRDDFADYLRAYADHHHLVVRTDQRVSKVIRDGDGWLVDDRAADVVVLATGHESIPIRPAWEGRESFQGPVVHSADYQNPLPFAGRKVLVVGGGNSGTEIAVDLLGAAASVHLAVRTPPLLAPTEVRGIPLQFIGRATEWVPWRYRDQGSRDTHRRYYADLADHGLPTPKLGMFRQFRATCGAPVAERGIADAIRQGRVKVVAALASLAPDTAILADGTPLEADAIIEATGYRPSYRDLIGDLDGVLDGAGRPTAWAAPFPEAPGLFIVGAPSLRGNLREHGQEAARVRAVVKALK